MDTRAHRHRTAPRTQRFRIVQTLAAAALVWTVNAELAPAQNHRLYIEELMTGANGDSRVQFLIIRQEVPGENLWGPQAGEEQSRAMLVFFDAVGRETGKFKFPESPPTGGTLRTLIATPEFQALPDAPVPDVVIPPMLNPVSGQACFRNNPANAAATPKNECVSYGDFRGDTENNWSGNVDAQVGAGVPAAALPITDTLSLRRSSSTGRNSDFTLETTPEPTNINGETFSLPFAGVIAQGEALFNYETFAGNGRTCRSCHVEEDGFGLSPGNIQERFAALRSDPTSFDPLFIGESKPSAFDEGFDFNLNSLVLTEEVASPSPCAGELRGVLTDSNGGRARVWQKVGPTDYLVYGGLNPPLDGTISDGSCSAEVQRILAGNLAPAPGALESGIENPLYMRDTSDPRYPQGRGLILENIDGFSNAPVFRKSPALLNLAYTAPYGLSGEFADLQSFSRGAIAQHFSRTLARRSTGASPDFREPRAEELAALEAFLLAQEFPAGDDPNKFDLTRYATTDTQRRGREDFFNFGCGACHGGPALSQTTVSIDGKPAGVNAAFNTGSTNPSFRGSLPCEPATPAAGPCGSREFSTPQLFNLPNQGPYFHNGFARTLEEAVTFYQTSEFGRSPSGRALIFQGVGVVPTESIIRFLEGLVARSYAITEGPIRFGSVPLDGPRPSEEVTITNTGLSDLDFDARPCRLTRADPDAFEITACPLDTALSPGESRTIRVAFDPPIEGLKSAILEVHPIGEAPSGIDLFGVGGPQADPPTVQEIGPDSGPASGGTPFTLIGDRFQAGATVLIGGVRAGFVQVVSSTTIVASTGMHSPGAADVVVVNPDGQASSRPGAYTYLDGP